MLADPGKICTSKDLHLDLGHTGTRERRQALIALIVTSMTIRTMTLLSTISSDA